MGRLEHWRWGSATLILAGLLSVGLWLTSAHGTVDDGAESTDSGVGPSEDFYHWTAEGPEEACIPSLHRTSHDEVTGSHTILDGSAMYQNCGFTTMPVYGSVAIVGHSWAELKSDGTRFTYVDAWLDDGTGECGWGHWVGYRTAGLGIVLNPVMHIDNNGALNMRSRHLLHVHEYTSSDCTTGYVTSVYKETWCESTSDRYFDLTTGILGECDAPYAVMSATSARRSYKVEIRSYVCDVGGSNCDTTYSDAGCLSIN